MTVLRKKSQPARTAEPTRTVIGPVVMPAPTQATALSTKVTSETTADPHRRGEQKARPWKAEAEPHRLGPRRAHQNRR